MRALFVAVRTLCVHYACRLRVRCAFRTLLVLECVHWAFIVLFKSVIGQYLDGARHVHNKIIYDVHSSPDSRVLYLEP